MFIDIISDIHVDLWLKDHKGKKLKDFVTKLLPTNISDTLIVAGDIGHYNTQNINTLKYLKEHYKDVLFVHGNHDMWLISNQQCSIYDWNSNNRIKELEDCVNGLDGIHYLNGNIININGVNVGGTCGYADTSFAQKQFKMNHNNIKNHLYKNFADSRYIYVGPGKKFDFMEYFNNQKDKLDKIVNDCDILVTHYIPIYERMRVEYKEDPYSTFFHFNGYDLVKKFKNKTWIYGHTHDSYDYVYDDVRFICNPLGYKGERFYINEINLKNFPEKIRTYEIK